jgi:hypothetical protein
MSELDRRLEDLFAADARARRVRSVAVAAPSRPPFALGLAAAAAIVLLLALALPALLGDGGGVAEPPVPSGTHTPAPTATHCIDETAVQTSIGGAKMGRYSGSSVDRVTVDGEATQWYVRFFVGAGADGAPGPLTIPLEATLAGPSGDVPVLGYAAGQPEGPFTPVSGRITVQPCRAVVLRITTARIGDGEYTLTLPRVQLPEGGEIDVAYRTRLVCTTGTSGATECDNPAGTRATPPPATVRPSPGLTPRPGFAVISGELGYPAGFRPELEVYAIDVDDPERWYSVTAPGYAGQGVGGTGTPPPDPGKVYAIEVPPGTYNVVAYIADRTRDTSPGLYSRYVLCGLRATCPDHTLIEVTVRAGETRSDVDPTDWYYRDGTPYPPRPED